MMGRWRLVLVAVVVGCGERGDESAPARGADFEARVRTVASVPPTAGAPLPARGYPSLAPLVETVRPTVVGVTSRAAPPPGEVPPGTLEDFWGRFFREYGRRERIGVGSGVIIDPEGLVLTNHHVVAEARAITVRTADEREFSAEVIGRDPEIDIALLRLEGVREPLAAARLGSSDALRVGDFVVAIGNPFGLELTVTSGLVSAKARVIGTGPFDEFLQTDAAINPGNSGGPLFALDGSVVGINIAIVAGGQGIGFAVPIDLVRSVLPQLVEEGRVVRGYLGIVIRDLTPELARAMDAPVEDGAVLVAVERGGPAAEAGLRPGDVVVAVDGERVESAAELSRAVARLRPGRRLTLQVFRDGEAREVEVVLGERPPREDDEERGPG